ncbi:MAG: hypothetical protein WBW48_15725 [Anaerolineae bacterium]
MEWEVVKPWVNRVGIVLEFLSFWLAAPEILGEERLRKLEWWAEQGIRAVGCVAPLVMALGTVMLLSMKDLWIRGAQTVTHFVEAIVQRVGVALSAGTLRILATVLMLASWVLLLWILGKLLEKFYDAVSFLLRILADDARVRQRSLAVGAVLFVVGFLLQFIATF